MLDQVLFQVRDQFVERAGVTLFVQLLDDLRIIGYVS